MRKSAAVIVKPLTTLAVIALAAMLPAGRVAAQTRPATTTQATTQRAILAEAIPVAESLRAFDLPNDGGKGIIVQWAKPADEPNGVTYIVQIARTKADFQAGKFETQEVSPSPKALASAKPAYFGYSDDANKLYYAEIVPAAVFGPAKPGPLTPERLKKFADKGVLTPSELDRALAAMKLLPQPAPTTKPTTSPAAKEQHKLTPAQQAELEWYQVLAAYLTKLDGEHVDAEIDTINSAPYSFRLGVKLDGQVALVSHDGEPIVVEAQAVVNLFKWGKLNNLILSLAFSAVVVAFIQVAKRKPGLFIRKIAGLEAIDEAIGRATEMDRPVFFTHGSGSVTALPVIASLNILSRIAYRAAEHDSRVRVMNQDPITTAVSQEIVQQAYTEAGRPDAYNPDEVSLVASDQFSYVAAVSGRMVREEPGAIFLMGTFGADSLLLSETGASTGAIQIAGTDSYTQLPFFVTTCDYTLMGEELYAASAYLSREPRLLGSLRGQDVGKAFIMIVLVLGIILFTAAAAVKGWDLDWLRRLLEASNA